MKPIRALLQRIPKLLIVLTAFRLINAISTRTFFQADEFWQALEPAHYKAFGFGQLTWEWEYGLRSYAFPLIFEVAYRLVSAACFLCSILTWGLSACIASIAQHMLPDEKLSNIDALLRPIQELPTILEYNGVIYAPKAAMAVIAAVGEYYTVKFIQKLHIMTMEKSDDEKGMKLSQITKISTVLTLTNFFNCFLITRTFINSFELCLTSIALFYWDWTGGELIHGADFTKSLVVAIFACLQRPSNALIWLVLGFFLVCQLVERKGFPSLVYLLCKISSVLAAVTLFNCIIDYYFYGELVFPVFRFLKFNFTSPLSNFYGVAPWHFHLTQSVPILLGLNIPLFLYGLFIGSNKRNKPTQVIDPLKQIKTVILISLLSFSSLAHKEFRFLYPLQPLFTLISSFALLALAARHRIKSRTLNNLFWALPFVSVFAALFLNSFNEAGVVSVMNFLHNEPAIDSVGFIMPCHSTPWQSHLHRNDIEQLWAITCEPPLHLLNDPDAHEKLPNYMDESDYLYEDVPDFIYKNFPPLFRKNLRSPGKQYKYEWPEYLVIFEHLKNLYFDSLLKDSTYIEVARFFNSFTHWDSRRQGDVLVYQKINDK
ncbi:hypothetical protein HG536_0A02630 [Torulaspora globosa]|uniref:Mannosyltransferase n=1 Tax=Torulaspora globosa TaxID=48254 RepID=A0A7G3ZAB0_9SACH|nr:uncharacterized protein HG536_0A02630 [Torulaspora globosa]QLL30446.1 hypothetical protein HG536_0A02630 [Torulaspora globosa]